MNASEVDPAEDGALSLDHLQAHPMELRKVGGDAVGEDDGFVAAVVGLADGGVHADLEGHAAHDELLDPVVVQNPCEVRGVEGAFAGLVDDRLALGSDRAAQ